MSPLDEAVAALHARGGEILPLIEQLVRMNSHTANVAGVQAVGEALAAALAGLPLTLERFSGGAYGDHLCARTHAAHGEPAVLLIGHHDTVFPPGTFETYAVDGDRARGAGVLDMKGGLSLVIVALRALHDVGLLARMPIAFVSVSDEEVGSPSSREKLEELARSARLALVFEAGRPGDAIVSARRGSGHAHVTAHGRAAHAGNALSEGRNAIWALAHFIDAAQGLTDLARGTSVSVGLVRGGTAKNTVPDLASCDADLRLADPEGERLLLHGLERAARAAEQAVPGTRIAVSTEISRRPWAASEANRALLQRYAACQREAGLSSGEAPRAGGGSDANTVAAVGLPAIDGLGPRGAGYHTRDEYIEISSLVPKAEALVRFLVRELVAQR